MQATSAPKLTYKDVNPGFPKTPGTTTNCVNCAVATDATLGGSPASALRSARPLSGVALEAHYGRKLVPIAGPADVEAALLKAGPGSRAIVAGSRAGQPGHVFNAVNDGGTVRFLDGQTGAPANIHDPTFTGWKMLQTNP